MKRGGYFSVFKKPVLLKIISMILLNNNKTKELKEWKLSSVGWPITWSMHLN
jgi:hypothetical protein